MIPSCSALAHIPPSPPPSCCCLTLPAAGPASPGSASPRPQPLLSCPAHPKTGGEGRGGQNGRVRGQSGPMHGTQPAVLWHPQDSCLGWADKDRESQTLPN